MKSLTLRFEHDGREFDQKFNITGAEADQDMVMDIAGELVANSGRVGINPATLLGALILATRQALFGDDPLGEDDGSDEDFVEANEGGIIPHGMDLAVRPGEDAYTALIRNLQDQEFYDRFLMGGSTNEN